MVKVYDPLSLEAPSLGISVARSGVAPGLAVVSTGASGLAKVAALVGPSSSAGVVLVCCGLDGVACEIDGITVWDVSTSDIVILGVSTR